MTKRIDYVRMTVIANNGTVVSEISEEEACHIRNNVFMRPGNVRIESMDDGYSIQDQNGLTILTAVFK